MRPIASTRYHGVFVYTLTYAEADDKPTTSPHGHDSVCPASSFSFLIPCGSILKPARRARRFSSAVRGRRSISPSSQITCGV